MKTKLLFLLLAAMICPSGQSQDLILPTPSTVPNEAQQAQIQRKYGMFIHFGINTFHDLEWTDGTLPASSYAPTQINSDQWIRAAKEVGMKYVILTAKHIDGFCLWDSKYTDYDVAASGNTTDVIAAVAKSCQKYGIGLGIYYALWDRKVDGDTYNKPGDSFSKYPWNPEGDRKYNEYMLHQLNEIMDITQQYTHIVEFWLDAGWVKERDRWPIMDIYQTIKRREPMCQVGINWTIGLPQEADHHPVYPADQKMGYPFRYFPSDFRLGDPMLPTDNDPKLFMHDGNLYYLPWESTVCIGKCWFYNTTDTVYKSLDELETLYRQATKNDNILIIDCPPDRNGELRERDITLLNALRRRVQF